MSVLRINYRLSCRNLSDCRKPRKAYTNRKKNKKNIIKQREKSKTQGIFQLAPGNGRDRSGYEKPPENRKKKNQTAENPLRNIAQNLQSLVKN